MVSVLLESFSDESAPRAFVLRHSNDVLSGLYAQWRAQGLASDPPPEHPAELPEGISLEWFTDF